MMESKFFFKFVSVILIHCTNITNSDAKWHYTVHGKCMMV